MVKEMRISVFLAVMVLKPGTYGMVQVATSCNSYVGAQYNELTEKDGRYSLDVERSKCLV